MCNTLTTGLIFDMDGTMVDSIPYHAKSWVVFCERHGIHLELEDLMRRTNGRNGAECMRELFQRPLDNAEAWNLIHEKEIIYRDLFEPVFREVPGIRSFANQAAHQGLKYGVGTAGDRHNIAFVFSHLRLDPKPLAVVGGDEGFPGKPQPDIFLEVANRMNAAASGCIVFEDAPLGIEAARRGGMRAVALCTTHSPDELSGPHVLTAVKDFNELLDMNFLETLNANA